MRTSHVRAFALIGALCCALIRLSAQTTNTQTVPLPPEVPRNPASTPAQTAPQPTTAATTPDVTATLPNQARRPSLMIQRGGREFEWRTSYSHSSSNTIFIDGMAIVPVIVVGQIGVERVRRDSVTTSFSARYGLANNLLTEVRVPFRFEYDRYSVPEVSPPQEKTISGAGLGDIEGAFYYQFPRAREESTRWIMNIGAKSRTGRDSFQVDTNTDVPLGTGFWNAKIGVSSVNIADPAAVFWNVGYTYTFERHDIPVTVTNPQDGSTSITYVDIKPASSFDIGGGFAYAVNPRLSINTGVSISYSGSAHSNGKSVPNTAATSASLRLGAVWLTENRFPVDLALSIGLTQDSPDFSLEFRRNLRL